MRGQVAPTKPPLSLIDLSHSKALPNGDLEVLISNFCGTLRYLYLEGIPLDEKTFRTICSLCKDLKAFSFCAYATSRSLSQIFLVLGLTSRKLFLNHHQLLSEFKTYQPAPFLLWRSKAAPHLAVLWLSDAARVESHSPTAQRAVSFWV